jgi:surface-anchored protein
MKTHRRMKNILSILMGLLTAGSLTIHATATVLWQGHADIGIGYENGAWDLHVHDEAEPPPGGTEYEPDEVILLVGATAEQPVPANPAFSFLGNPGESVWILPQNEDPSLLFLGIATEEIEAGFFEDDRVALTLAGYNGPGHFALYQVDGLGSPTIFMNTRDGVSSVDRYEALVGTHAHFNWAFSEPGTYTLSFEGSGILLEGGLFTSSGPVDYTFTVVPEPSTYLLFGLGAVALVGLVRRQRQRV